MTRTNKLGDTEWQEAFACIDRLDALPESDRAALWQSLREELSPAAAVAVDRWLSAASTDGAGDPVGIPVALARPGPNPPPGHRVGNYRLVERIGAGGMGSVWRAQRADGLFEAEVAVKLLGSLALSAQARARFEREGRLLARLSHPHITRLLDAGLTEDHQRFLVLELVRGQDVVSHVKTAKLPLPAMLGLFRQLLSAVAFAHAQLVIHRDIKPANVMVTTVGEVKLLDFGIARLVADSGDEPALTQILGTAYTEAYAAPEQIRGEVVGVAADIFALGCLLHELLWQAPPRWSRPKRELGPHDLPLEPSAPGKNLPADLRAIVLKAIAVDPGARYVSAASFDDDIARLLQGAAVQARAPTRRYRFARFVSQYRRAVAASAAAFAVVCGSLGLALWQLGIAQEQRATAVREAARATAVTKFLTDLFRVSDPRKPVAGDRQAITARQLLDEATHRLERELHDQPETRLALLGVLTEIYGFLEDEEKYARLNAERIRFGTARLGNDHPAVVEARLLDVDADIYSGQYDRARQAMDELEPIVRRVWQADSEPYATLLGTRAELERRAAREAIGAVVARFDRAAAIFARLGTRTENAAIVMQNHASALESAGALEPALETSAKAIAIFEQLPHADRGNLAFSHLRRAELLARMGRHDRVERDFDRAVALLADSYGAHSAVALRVRLGKALWLHQQHRRSEAWALVAQVEAVERASSADTFGVPEQHFVRGRMLAAEGRLAEARADLGAAIAGWEQAANNPARLRQARAALAALPAASASR